MHGIKKLSNVCSSNFRNRLTKFPPSAGFPSFYGGVAPSVPPLECLRRPFGRPPPSAAVKEKSLKPTDVIWDGGSDTLEVGLTFQSRSLVKKFLSGYGDQSFCNMVVAEGGVQDGSKSRKVKK